MWAGLLLAALLLNGMTLIQAGDALAESMRNRDDEPEPKVMEFEMVEAEEEPVVESEQLDGRIPDEATGQDEANSNPKHETRAAIRPDRPGSTPQQPGEPREGEPQPDQPEPLGQGEQDGEPNMHEAPDGQQSKAGQLNPVALGGSTGALRAAFGEHGTHDDLRDVDEGETNVLKAKRNLYASFFNRLRDRVAEHWEPERAHKAVDPNQKLFGTSARTTVLWIRLDEQGGITKIVVKRSSGADHLDDEAIRAMKAAAPFPNPPEDLVDGDGFIEFDFGFTLDFVEGGRIFRYQR